MTSRAKGSKGNHIRQGFALLLVLWSLALLALIGGQIVAAGRTETRLATNLREGAAAEAAADGAVFQAAWRVQAGTWPAGGTAALAVGGIPVEVTVADENARVALNRAGLPLLTALLRDLDLDPAIAAAQAGRLLEWRSPTPSAAGGGTKTAEYAAARLPYAPANQPFENVTELGLVLGMTPRLVALLAPHVSPYADATTAGADTLVGDALQDSTQGQPSLPNLPAIPAPAGITQPRTIRVTAVAESAATATRIAVLHLLPTGPRVMAWETR